MSAITLAEVIYQGILQGNLAKQGESSRIDLYTVR
jgi:hypothetical protein